MSSNTLSLSASQSAILQETGTVEVRQRMEPQPPAGWEPHPDYNEVSAMHVMADGVAQLSCYGIYVDDGSPEGLVIRSPWEIGRIRHILEYSPFVDRHGQVVSEGMALRLSAACLSVTVEQGGDGWQWVGKFEVKAKS